MAAMQEKQHVHVATEEYGMPQEFLDLDDPAVLDQLFGKIYDGLTSNFVVDFSAKTAVCAFDQPVQSISAFLELLRPDGHTQWINIWSPFHQRPLLELLAQQYDFSPRLLALMCSNPYETRHFEPSSIHLESSWKPFWNRHTRHEDEGEAEKYFCVDELSNHAMPSSTPSIHGNLYRIIDSIWHYCSVDFGRKYICIGYNSLYGTKTSRHIPSEGPLPHCVRVWSWLLLCDDNTVISITEDPFPQVPNTQLSELQQRVLIESRRNLTNVFRSLSAVDAGSMTSSNPLKFLPIRRGLDTHHDEANAQTSDAPSLLFYYLFENWHNSYTLVTRRESRFGVELNALRSEMFTQPRLRHIDRLDRLGKELGVLRRHFDAHERIIDRLLEPRGGAPMAGLQTVQVVNEVGQLRNSVDDVRSAVVVTAAGEEGEWTGITAAAKARFRRLRDLIDVYALSEVEDYIKQKDALVAMNFNLIAIKQSGDVERLTRITLLLTKITILFTPISLMTAYFSTQLQDTQYSIPVYWISFTVVFVLSWLALFVLGVFSGTVQTLEVLKGTWQGLRRILKA